MAMVYEILERVCKARHKSDKVKILKENETWHLKMSSKDLWIRI